MKRKELKSQGKIVGGYVAFPAKLMIKKTLQSKYELAHDFSNIDVNYHKP